MQIMRFRKLSLTLILGLLVFGVFIYLPFDCSTNPDQPLANCQQALFANPTTSENINDATLAFERTAIAKFTQNPSMAISLTPYYVEIIFNDVIRQLTETPLIYRTGTYTLYESPTPAPSSYAQTEMAHFWTQIAKEQTASSTLAPTAIKTITSTAQPDARCSPVISNRSLYELSISFEELFKNKGIDTVVSILSVGVEGIDQYCAVPFQPVYTNFSIGIDVTEIENYEALKAITEKLFKSLINEQEQLENLSHLSTEVRIIFRNSPNSGETKTATITFNYTDTVKHYSDSHRNIDIIEFLGGLTIKE